MGAAALFSTGGATIKAIDALGGLRGGLEVASLRSGIAGLTLGLALPRARRGWTRRTWLVGAAYAATVVLFVLANRETTAAAAILLQSTAPLYVLVAGTLLLRERPRGSDIVVMLAMAAALGLFVSAPGPALETAPRPELGTALALASGVTWAATLVGLRAEARSPLGDSAPLAAVVAGNLLAFAVCLPVSLPLGSGPRDALLIAYLGFIQIGLAYLLLTAGMRRVPAFAASLLLLVEPALSPVWAWLVHDEVPAGATLAAGALILGASAVKVMLDVRPSSSSPAAVPP